MQREDKLQKYGLKRKNCPAFRSFAHMKQTLVVNGRHVAYISQVPSGSGVLPLVLLHGLCEDADIWAPMLPLLENIPLIQVDLPGFGASVRQVIVAGLFSGCGTCWPLSSIVITISFFIRSPFSAPAKLQ
jgi:pimeloyl-ACP methyl ester carboxylesterase